MICLQEYCVTNVLLFGLVLQAVLHLISVLFAEALYDLIVTWYDMSRDPENNAHVISSHLDVCVIWYYKCWRQCIPCGKQLDLDLWSYFWLIWMLFTSENWNWLGFWYVRLKTCHNSQYSTKLEHWEIPSRRLHLKYA